MNRKQHPERLVTYLRWAVILVLASAGDHIRHSHLFVVVGALAVYNAAIFWCVADARRYLRHGRTICASAWMLDIAAISFVVGGSGNVEVSQYYLLYWFVLVSLGFVCPDLTKLAVVTGYVLVANAAAATYSLSTGNLELLPSVIGSRSVMIILGALVAAYVLKSRGQDDLAAEHQSYLCALADYGTKLTSFKSTQELANYVLESAVAETGASGGLLLLANPETQELECDAFHPIADGEETDAVSQESIMTSYANWVVGTGKEFLVRSRSKEREDAANTLSNRPAVAIPLLWQSSNADGVPSVVGVLVVVGSRGKDFGEGALSIVRIFAAMSSAAIISLRLYTNLQRSFLRTLQSLAKGLEARDEYTRGHSERVMQVACLIAERLDVPTESMDVLRNASLLHDIGKIGVPDAVLRKAGKLTSEEWEVMRRHPIASEEICRPLGLSDDVLFLIKHHHERLDGKGYPAGLSPQDQPLLQRILVVADSFDAMRSRRPYRDTVPEHELRLELSRGAGRTMDPTVVETLLALMDDAELDQLYEEHDRMIQSTVIRPRNDIRRAA